MSGLTEATNGKFLNIAQGRFRIPCDKENPKAVKREGETKDGKTFVKYELVYSKIQGMITKIDFRQSDFGEQLSLHLNCGEDDYILNIGLDSRYAKDFMQRFPGIDLGMEVELTPYDMEDERGKKNTGIKVVQNGETVKNQYWDYENKKPLLNFPQMQEENPDTDDWKTYFIQVKKFLKKQLLAKLEAPMEITAEQPTHKNREVVPDEQGDDLPF